MKTKIDPTLPRQTIRFRGATLTLDAKEIVVGDPGAGTPAVIREGRACATYACASSEGEDADGNRFSPAVCDWMNEIVDEVDGWETHQVRIAKTAAR